ncbi:uncharacterized protein C8R40DRAFT_323229 [Lentinula edodes]|uniref:uncharacterized protein n=1 Tax=Lentinula edodes TaxID=5353 RepID=UPI001E8E27DF|nr:uncharacterized protein C8R40DRAFT_323229 [Lentinula edodes]KAH7874479.1 hypothetical protein C8R40DRAFT_323229 [Lentinula edodes]
MHRLNIFLSCIGHSGWAGSFFFGLSAALTLTITMPKIVLSTLVMRPRNGSAALLPEDIGRALVYTVCSVRAFMSAISAS